MKRLSRIKGYRESEIKFFNKMYERLIERIADSADETEESCYSAQELSAFKAYLILAEADEMRRIEKMRHKRTLHDFTPEEISRFDHMQEVLTEFNLLLDDDSIEFESIIPSYSDIEMMEHSQYRELWIANKCELH